MSYKISQADREAAASVAVLPELLPCPFCGGEAESDLSQPFRHYYTGEPLSQPAVYCTVCSAQIAHYPGDVDLSRDETMDLALTAWNTRADSHHRLVEALREIQRATLEGRVCDDVAWFDRITTLYDYIEEVLHPSQPAAIGDLFPGTAALKEAGR